MFARAVSIKVNPGFESELTRILEYGVIPLFRREKDFLGLLAFIRPDGTEALSFSLWDKEEGAGASCPAGLSALTALAGVVRGAPSAQVYEVSDSTLRTMEEMLGQREEVEATLDLEVYQSCATTFPIVTDTVHSELRFPARLASYESDKKGNPILCRPKGTRTRREKQFKNESHARGSEGLTNDSGRPGTSPRSEGMRVEQDQ
jgi:hypothetical protein